MIRVCLAGATGWAGSELARAIVATDDIDLVAGVSRTYAGRTLGEALGDARLTIPVYGSAAEALAAPCDVLVEYTHPDSAKANVVTALERMGIETFVKNSSKWVPFVGTMVSAGVGYKLTYHFGEQLIDDCETAARQMIATATAEAEPPALPPARQ